MVKSVFQKLTVLWLLSSLEIFMNFLNADFSSPRKASHKKSNSKVAKKMTELVETVFNIVIYRVHSILNARVKYF